MAVDVVIAALCRLGCNRAFERAVYRKLAKYKSAVDDGTIAIVVPFVMSPFGIHAKSAKAFVKRVMGGNHTPPAKLAKARLRLSVAAARGTVHLSHAWSMCAALILGDF
jgi:hypothetical protein